MNIRSQKSSTFLVSESCPNNIMVFKFKESESESLSINFTTYKKYYNHEYERSLSKDNFIILHNINKELEIKDYKFMLITSLLDSYQEYLGRLIGLKFKKKKILKYLKNQIL